MVKGCQRKRWAWAGLAAALWAGLCSGNGAPLRAEEPNAEAVEFFEKRVRPVLVEHCQECHGPKTQEAGLRLDLRTDAFKGGESGAAILPGKADQSRLLKVIRYDGDTQMPPDGKLPQPAIDAISQWIQAGAAWPADSATATAAAASATSPEAIAAARQQHWAFRPVQRPALPPLKNKAWVATEVDHFVLARLEAAGLSPVSVADRRTLLRRASYDLTGLPPTDEDLAAFTSDPSPDAWAKAIDRLLESPHYGERWARHWLDVARYADTKGYVFQEERRYPFAYTYRDYVIRAFNNDLPYDRFLLEQLAADLLDLGEDKSPLAAMGFLTLGRRFLNNTHDIIDDRIDVVMRGTQGMTVSCARCHDHKFDPIPSADYYSLYGVFASTHEPKDLPQIAEPKPTKEFEAYQRELNKRQAELDKYLEQKRAEYRAKLGDKGKDLPPERIDAMFDRPTRNGQRDRQKKIDQWRASSPAAPERAMVLLDNEHPNNPVVFKRGNPRNRGDQVPRQYLAVLTPNRQPFKQGSGRLEMAQTIASRNNPLTARVMVNRVWQYHFGQGLVSTPSDFGLRSDPPTHPELLDFLAWQFMEEGWSVKQLHRRIMLSRTYQLSSQASADQLARDPENRLLGHANRRRLDFEAQRDSLLFVSGQLDFTLFGRPVELTTTPYSTRRTLYGFVDRQNLEPLFRTFDFASPDSTSPERFTTTIPQQALFMLNNPFAIEQAQHLAARAVEDETASASVKVERLYQLAYGRLPHEKEMQQTLAFVKQHVGNEPSEPLPLVWQYGYGEFDAAANRLKAFQPLPHFGNQSWQGGEKMPDAKLGWVLLNATGGHPGNDQAHSAVRRWTAPVAGKVRIEGLLKHPNEQGDGVRARVVSSRTGKHGEWSAHHRDTPTTVDTIEISPGDTLDFIVDCLGNPNFDSFQWSPQIHLTTDAPVGQPKHWNSQSEFSGSRDQTRPLTVWDRVAQVLLMSNEFVFLD